MRVLTCAIHRAYLLRVRPLRVVWMFATILLSLNSIALAQVTVDKLAPLSPTEQWQGWENLGSVTASGPECVATQVNRLDCFTRVAGGLLTRKQWNGAQWNGPMPIAGVTMDVFHYARPKCVTLGSDHIDCFARRRSDKALFQRTIHGGFMTGWQALGGNLSSDPDCIGVGGGRIDCFARNNTPIGELMQNSFDGNIWSGWQSRGGQILEHTKPSCVVFRQEVHCIVVGSDSKLRQFQLSSAAVVVRAMSGEIVQSNFGKGGNTTHKCLVTQGPDLNSDLDDVIHCLAGKSNTLLHVIWNGQGNQSWAQSDAGSPLGYGDWDCLRRGELRIDCMELVGTIPNDPNQFFMRHHVFEPGQGVRISDVKLPVPQGVRPELLSCVSWASDRIDCFAAGGSSNSPLMHSWLMPVQPLFKKPHLMPRQ